MKAKIQERKDGVVTLQLEDGQNLRLPESSVNAENSEENVVLIALSESRAKDDATLGRSMINELLT